MPSNHTEHHDLSQWEPEDAVLRADFNEDNRKIDAALAALDGTVSAHTTTLSGHTGSIAKLGNCQIYTTTYTGTGDKSRSYSFPGYPVYVFIRCPNLSNSYNLYRGLNDSTTTEYSAQWSDRGLSLRTPDSNNFGINIKNYTFFVMALLDMSK